MTYQLKAIGKVKNDENGTFIQLAPEYIPGLQALEGFSHINVLWWFSDCDNDADRNELQTNQPYKGAKSWVYLRHDLLHVRTLLH